MGYSADLIHVADYFGSAHREEHGGTHTLACMMSKQRQPILSLQVRQKHSESLIILCRRLLVDNDTDGPPPPPPRPSQSAFFPSSADHHFHVIGDLGSMVLQLRVGVSDRNSQSTSIPHGILQLLVHEERKDVLATGGLDELAI